MLFRREIETRKRARLLVYLILPLRKGSLALHVRSPEHIIIMNARMRVRQGFNCTLDENAEETCGSRE